MPQYSTRPPKDAKGYGLSLLRTPANGRLIIAVTSDELVGCPTHWYGGRTIPCEAENCPACRDGIAWRWHGYLSGLVHTTRRLVLAEFTAQACETITQYAEAQGGLRGAILTSQRHRNRHNGRVIVNLVPGDLSVMQLPPAPDILKALAMLWNLPRPNLSDDRPAKNMKRIQPAPIPDGNNRPTVKQGV